MPLSECEFTLNNALDELARDAFAPAPDCRPARCTGTALAVAAALAAAALPPGVVRGAHPAAGRRALDRRRRRCRRQAARRADPLAQGPGQGRGPALLAAACKHYAALAACLAAAGHALDVYACSLDQVGIAEMKPAVERTGGLLVQADTFANPVFRESLRRALGGWGGDCCCRLLRAPEQRGRSALAPPEPLGVASNGILEVVASRDVRVAGLLGPASPLPRLRPGDARTLPWPSPRSGSGERRRGSSRGWTRGRPSPSTLRPAAPPPPTAAATAGPAGPGAAGGPQLYIQFVTRYLHATGAPRTRVTTLTRRWVDGAADGGALVAGFDQEAAAVAVARLATFKMETEEDFDATRWLDRTLIRLCSRFGEYRRDDPASFGLAARAGLLPAVSVQPAPQPVRAGLRREPRRDGRRAPGALPRARRRRDGDDPADAARVLPEQGPVAARAGAAGRGVDRAGPDPAAGRVLLRGGVPRGALRDFFCPIPPWPGFFFC